jgi:hypothetical protein
MARAVGIGTVGGFGGVDIGTVAGFGGLDNGTDDWIRGLDNGTVGHWRGLTTVPMAISVLFRYKLQGSSPPIGCSFREWPAGLPVLL